VVTRKDSKVDAFQRQITALRHQLGGEHHDLVLPDLDRRRTARIDNPYRADLAGFDDLEPVLTRSARGEGFDQAPVSKSESPLPAVPAADSLTSVIAHTTTWTGSLESSGSLHVHGRVDGSLTAQEDVYIAEEADVDATINAANVTIAGNVRGTINCAERFEVLPRGRVAGNVSAPVIVIHDGATVAGEISMGTTSGTRMSAASTGRVARGGD
jgi:cytoskeletal protein CcmA (bactofilin family)